MKSTASIVIAAAVALAVTLLAISVILLGVRTLASARLHAVAESMRGLAADSIETTIAVRQTMQLDADIRITKPTNIDLTLQVADKIPIKLEVKVNDSLKVPIDLPIDEKIGVEAEMTIPRKSNIRVKADIGLDQPLKWRVAHPISPLLNIKGSVPLDQDVEITFPETLQVKGTVPVRFRLQKEIMVPIAFDVPVNQMLDLKLAIEQQARVGFPEPLHIVGEIPVVMEIPVQIPLGPTPVGKYLGIMADQLEQLLAW